MLFSRFSKKPLKERKYVVFGQTQLPVNIYHENRQNNRVTIGKSGITIRLSNYFSEVEKNEQIQQFLHWSFKKLEEKPDFFQKKTREYADEMLLNLFDRTLTVRILDKKVAKASGMMKGNEIYIVLPESEDHETKQALCAKIVLKILSKIYKPIIRQKLEAFNQQFEFGKLNNLTIKNNSSNWGSCSTRGNINISARLLLANEGAVNYVLIHELAHLREPNHSDKFWMWVKKACPDYKIHELWLKQNSHLCIL